MRLNIPFDVEVEGTATSSTNETLVLRRLRALGEEEQTEEVLRERRYLRKLLKKLRRRK